MMGFFSFFVQVDEIILILSILLFVGFIISLIAFYSTNKKINHNLMLLALVCPLVIGSILFKQELNKYTDEKLGSLVPEKFSLSYNSFENEVDYFSDNNGNIYSNNVMNNNIEKPVFYIEEGASFVAFAEKSHRVNYKINIFSKHGTHEVYQSGDLSRGNLIDSAPKTGVINYYNVLDFVYELGSLAYDSYNKTINVMCYSNMSADKLTQEYQPSYFYHEGKLIKKNSYDFSKNKTILKVTQNLNTVYLVK
ncbi:MAG: hypothetical protein SO253_02440 [Bacilli bacterium]|nr:hypothetical protein [Bacilli bacterium]